MHGTYERCAGLDIHKKTVVACVLVPDRTGRLTKDLRTFTTMTTDLLALADWLTGYGVTHVALESTGEFWKPISNLLEPSFTMLVVTAQHSTHVPGRKTDVKDAEWIADLLRHGLVRGSFIPPVPQRDLRDLTRQRTLLVQERATVVNRLQQVREWANLKLAGVATDVLGVSARAMLEAIVAGETDPVLLADLAKGRLRAKRAILEQALQGIVRDHHRFLITNHLLHSDVLDEQIATFSSAITQHSAAQTPAGDDDVRPTDPPQPNEHAVPPTAGAALPLDAALSTPTASPADAVPPIRWEDALAVLDTIPGVGPRVAEIMLAEIGPDMTRFPDAAHLARWARVCPDNHERAGKRSSGKTGKGNPWLRSAVIQAAHAAVNARDSWLGRVYRRLVPRLGVKQAMVAIAHRLIIAIYHRLRKQEPYRETTTVPDDAAQKLRRLKRVQQQVEA